MLIAHLGEDLQRKLLGGWRKRLAVEQAAQERGVGSAQRVGRLSSSNLAVQAAAPSQTGILTG